ncbi:MAG: hypothetical protein KDK61_08770, partial [Simkania sp.]|nr:hypothetical protein [Simkania sp.]
PSTFLMEEVGEKVLVEPDSKILTEEDYPVRNVYQVRAADAILGISGASGTFMEMLLAVNDYQLPAAYYEGSSWEIDNWLKTDKLFQEKVYEGKNVLELITYLESSFRYLKSSF